MTPPDPSLSGRSGALLSDLTTLRVGGPASRLVEARSEEELVATVLACDAASEPVLLLGGGSNLLVSDAGFVGTVVHVRSRGVEPRIVGGSVLLRVAAGEGWDPLVARTVSEGWSGLESLAGIPGSVGAAPVQNVGAYGYEVSDVLRAVRVLDRLEGRVRSLAASECELSYRSSVFRGSDRYVVLELLLELRTSPLGAPVRYPQLASALGVDLGGSAPLEEVRAAVLSLRRSKGMVLDDVDRDTWSAGSFFKNPVLSPARAAALPPGAPSWPTGDGRVKVSAAWLVGVSGFPLGFSLGRAGLSTKHLLALTNRGSASATELALLARTVRSGVEARTGVRLELEPLLVGLEL